MTVKIIRQKADEKHPAKNGMQSNTQKEHEVGDLKPQNVVPAPLFTTCVFLGWCELGDGTPLSHYGLAPVTWEQ